MSNSSIWLVDRTLSGATTPGQNGPGNNGNEVGNLHFPKLWHYESLTIKLFSVISRTLIGVESSCSVEMQSKYSIAAANSIGWLSIKNICSTFSIQQKGRMGSLALVRQPV